MHCLLNIILLFCITIINLTVGLINIRSIRKDLRGKEVCRLDTCSYPLNDTDLFVGCHCDKNCAEFGTCCLDSPYIQTPRPKIKPVCSVNFNEKPYFMVDRCPTSDSVWEGLCRQHIAYSDENDFLQIVPVTSLLTSVTYRNYFCFRCHEANDEFVHWKVKFVKYVYDGEVESISSEDIHSDFEKQLFKLTFKDGYWRASFRNDLVSIILHLSVVPPQEIRHLVRLCIPMTGSCSANWTDFEISRKCEAYMAVREVDKGYKERYKNMHCALCNFEDVKNVKCVDTDAFIKRDPSGKKFFTFSHLLDINNADGDEVGKIKKCEADHIWDRFAGKCRKLTCAIKEYKIRDGKCQP